MIRNLIASFEDFFRTTRQFSVPGWMIAAFSLAQLAITAGAVTQRLDASGSIRLSPHHTRKKLHDDALSRLADAMREGKPFLTDLHRPHEDESPHLDAIAPIFTAGSAGIPESVYIDAQSSFDMKLITLLIQQIERTLECVRGGGTTFRINVKYIEGEGNVVAEGGKTK